MEGVSISNITIEGSQSPLYIRLGNRARKHTESASEPGVGILRDVVISNIVAYHTGNFGGSITAIPGHYVENVSLSNIRFHNKGLCKQATLPVMCIRYRKMKKGTRSLRYGKSCRLQHCLSVMQKYTG
ncbi:hypothetical protein KRR40_40470 [Niabella defluvii]|nr:hypothetical protein KRR40_40470 [Niabella sp. I65]